MNDEQTQKHLLIRIASWLAVLVALILITIKFIAWWLSDSVAIFGSLLDSVFDFSISAINFWTVRHAMSPADNEHRYGHGKAESLAAFAQSLIIAASALYLLTEAIAAFINPTIPKYSGLAIIVMCISIILTLGLVFVQRMVAKKTQSLAIAADSMHYQGDLLMNLGVIAALALASGLAWAYADPIMGVVVSAILLFSAANIAKAAINQLMDRELEDTIRNEIKTIILSHKDVHGLHDLRTRRAGMQSFVQCHIELDGTLSLKDAHRISDEVEDLVMKTFPQTEVIIHQDPKGYETLTRLEKS